MFSFFHFPRSNVVDSNYHKQKWRVLCFTRTQNIGPCAGVCACNCMDQMDKTAYSLIKFNFLRKPRKTQNINLRSEIQKQLAGGAL